MRLALGTPVPLGSWAHVCSGLCSWCAVSRAARSSGAVGTAYGPTAVTLPGAGCRVPGAGCRVLPIGRLVAGARSAVSVSAGCARATSGRRGLPGPPPLPGAAPAVRPGRLTRIPGCRPCGSTGRGPPGRLAARRHAGVTAAVPSRRAARCRFRCAARAACDTAACGVEAAEVAEAARPRVGCCGTPVSPRPYPRDTHAPADSHVQPAPPAKRSRRSEADEVGDAPRPSWRHRSTPVSPPPYPHAPNPCPPTPAPLTP